MRKLSEMNDATLLYSESEERLMTVEMVREYIENDVDIIGKHYTVHFGGSKGLTLVDEVEIDVVSQ